MSIMVGWMGVMVGDGDSWSIARASTGDGGRRIIDGGGAVTAGGLAVAEAVSEGGRGVDDVLCCSDGGSGGSGDGADLPDGDRRT